MKFDRGDVMGLAERVVAEIHNAQIADPGGSFKF